MAGETMQAWQLPPGARSADDLQLVELPKPVPDAGEVLVRIRACSLNYRDKLIAGGMYPAEQPFVPLSDGTGEIEAVGEGVTRFRRGDRVAGSFLPDWVDGPPRKHAGKALGQPGAAGMLAEYVALPEQAVLPLAGSLDFVEAATLPCAGVTAWNALMEGGKPLIPGDWLLVLGTGGVALLALQIAKAAGAGVIVTSSSDAKLKRARDLGADAGINYRRQPLWGQQAARISQGGVQRVLETGGPGTLAQSLEAIGHAGEICLIGVMAQGETPALHGLLARSATVRGISVGSRAMAERLNRAVDAGGIRPVIDRRFGFGEAREAFRHQNSAEPFGKVVIEVN